jgi:hypothetical protein
MRLGRSGAGVSSRGGFEERLEVKVEKELQVSGCGVSSGWAWGLGRQMQMIGDGVYSWV